MPVEEGEYRTRHQSICLFIPADLESYPVSATRRKFNKGIENLTRRTHSHDIASPYSSG